MPDYRRNWVPGGTYFFTVALLERKRDLLVTEIGLLQEAVRRVKRLYPFEIIAWVVLPDHLHCVWTLPPGDADYATRWRLIKLLFAKGLPKQERLSAVRKRRRERGVWHRRYWEHTIRDERDLANHVDYVHWNPMKHGLVARVADWPYSTFHRLVRLGLYPLDWAGASEVDLLGRMAEPETGAAKLRGLSVWAETGHD
jgi:putative transposase